jgi:hypothetical protein
VTQASPTRDAGRAMQTFEGGCHCGVVRFRVAVEEDQELIDCNCSICTKKGIVHFIVPEERFAVLRGESELAVYTFNTGVAKHMFCKTCGIHAFYRPRSHPGFWDVNARCLDDPAVLLRFAVKSFDGRSWEAHVDEIR